MAQDILVTQGSIFAMPEGESVSELAVAQEQIELLTWKYAGRC